MGNACLAGLLSAGLHPYKAMLPASSVPQKGRKRALRHRSARSNFTFLRHYDVSFDLVGKGVFGTVCKTKSRQTGAECVIKTVTKSGMDQESLSLLANEIAIHDMCDHPCITRVYESFEGPDKVHIAMEACDGGDLQGYARGRGSALAEADVKIVMGQVLQAVFYLHDAMNVAHRDVKLENLLLKYKGVPLDENVVKLIDFGFAQGFTPGERCLDIICGSPAYMAPEILNGPYDEKCDIWSCGVALHELLVGELPFDSDEAQEIPLIAAARPLLLRGPAWAGVSADARSALRGMLRLSPLARVSAAEALRSAWLEATQLGGRKSSEVSSSSASSSETTSDGSPTVEYSELPGAPICKELPGHDPFDGCPGLCGGHASGQNATGMDFNGLVSLLKGPSNGGA